MRIHFLVFLKLGPCFILNVVVGELDPLVRKEHAKGFCSTMTLEVFDRGNSIRSHITTKVLAHQLPERVIPNSGPLDASPLQLRTMMQSFKRTILQQGAILLVEVSCFFSPIVIVVKLHALDHYTWDSGS